MPLVKRFGLNVLVAGLGEMKRRAFAARRGRLARLSFTLVWLLQGDLGVGAGTPVPTVILSKSGFLGAGTKS